MFPDGFLYLKNYTISEAGKINIPEPLSRFLKETLKIGKSVIAISFGNPYIFRTIAFVDAYLYVDHDDRSTQSAMISALLGKSATMGKLPVTILDYFEAGTGIFV